MPTQSCRKSRNMRNNEANGNVQADLTSSREMRKRKQPTTAAPVAAVTSSVAPKRKQGQTVASGVKSTRCDACRAKSKSHCGTIWAFMQCENRPAGLGPPPKWGRGKGLKGKNCFVMQKEPSAAAKANRQFFPSVEVDGEVYRCGDSVYVFGANAPATFDEDDELCEVCCKDADQGTMLECDVCLRGFHLKCLKPPLKSVPEGDWLCGDCTEQMDASGAVLVVPSSRNSRTARDMFLSHSLEMMMGRVERIWRDGAKGGYQFTIRWYMLPEETHTGRQAHHARREVFLSSITNDNEVDVIFRKTTVASPAEYARMWDSGDDVYMCEYLYDATWNRFRRIEERAEPNAFSTGPLAEADLWDAEEQAQEEEDAEEEDSEWSGDEGGEGARRRGRERAPEPKRRRRQTLSAAGKKQKGALLPHVVSMQGPARAHKGGNKRGFQPSFTDQQFEVFGERKNILSMGLSQVPQFRTSHKAEGPFAQARAALTLAAAPRTLPCREVERNTIRKFLHEAVASGSNCLGRCLYMYGVPGTGKTATACEVVRQLYDQVHQGSLPAFQFVEINGLRLPSPNHAYTVIWEALTGQHAAPARAAELLDDYFASSKERPVTVLLVDELDLLVTRNQMVLYNLFDWPTRKNSQLVVVGIANTMDLPERLLPRIASRVGLQRISFQPYSQEQLQKIVRARLEGLQAFNTKAVELASRKVAAVSGDARRTLELCRRAAEIAEEEWNRKVLCELGTSTPDASGKREPSSLEQIVGLEHISAAVKELYGEPHMHIWRTCDPHAKVALCALLCEQRRSGLADACMEDVYNRYVELCGMNSMQKAPWGALSKAISKLGEARMLLCEPGNLGCTQRIALNWSTDSVEYSLKTHAPDVPWLCSFMQKLTAA